MTKATQGTALERLKKGVAAIDAVGIEVLKEHDIVDAEEYEQAGELLKWLQGQKKHWENEKELATRALKDEYDSLCAQYRPVLKKIEGAMGDLKAMTGRYVLEQRRRQDALLAAAREQAAPLAEMELVKAARQAVAPAIKGLTQKVTKVAVVVDERLVPEKYWRRVIDMAHVQSDADAGVTIPGVQAQDVVQTIVRRQ